MCTKRCWDKAACFSQDRCHRKVKMACRHDVVTSQSGRSRSLADGCLALPAPSSWRKVEGSSRSECSFSASLFGLHRLLLALWLESWARHGAQRARGMRFLGLPVAALAVAVLPGPASAASDGEIGTFVCQLPMACFYRTGHWMPLGSASAE